MTTTVGVIGLGNMGSAMAAALLRAGFDVLGTASTAATRNRVAADGITTVDSIARVAAKAQFVVLALPTPAAVMAVVEGPDGLTVNARPGQLVIDTTTSDPTTTRHVAAALAAVGVRFLDAPVSGAPQVAREGKLTMMLGGEASDIDQAMPVLKALSAVQIPVGALGSGQVVKLANNLLAAAHLAVAAEVVAYARAAGLDIDVFLRVINSSSGRSFITERVYPNWIQRGNFDLGFTVGLMRKDVRLATEEIHRQRLELPLVDLVRRLWQESGDLVGDAEDITRMVELPARRQTGGLR